MASPKTSTADTIPAPSYISRNGLMIAYKLLKTNFGRFLDNTVISPFEDFYEKVGRSIGLPQNQYVLSNAEVEQFYTDQLSEPNFVATAESRLIRAAISPATSPTSSLTVCPLGDGTVNAGQPGLLSPEVKLLSVVWDMYTQTPDISMISSRIPRVCGMCLWQMFLCLDKDSQMRVPVEDVYELVNLIFKANSQSVTLETVQEWFCGETTVDFHCFLQSLVEGYSSLLQASAIQDVYTVVCLKQLKQAKMMKKGHVVHNWKMRWFILSTADVRYYESQEALVPKGCINITSASQVQKMPEAKGHLYKFRVVDGISGTGTEISCQDDQQRKEWMQAIKLVMKLNSIEGRNFVHKYAQALESVPKSARGVVKRLEGVTTSPTKTALSSSKSVPFDQAIVKNGNGRGRRKLPVTPDDAGTHSLIYVEEHRQLAPQQPSLDEYEYNGEHRAPPVPPLQLRSLQLNRPALEEYDIDGTQSSLKSPKLKLRRTSSTGELEESIKHLQVGDEEYALVSKPTKMTKKISVPAVLPQSTNSRNGNVDQSVNPPRFKKKKSPPMPFRNKKLQSNPSVEHQTSFEEATPKPQVSAKTTNNTAGNYADLNFFRRDGDNEMERQALFEEGTPKPQTSAKPTNNTAGSYAELSFFRKDGDNEMASPSVPRVNPIEEPPPVLHNPKTKYGYSTILFDETKQKNIIVAERLKKDRGPPPPIPGKFQGDTSKAAKKLKQYLSDSNTASLQSREQKFQGKARPISAGANRTPATGVIHQNGVNHSHRGYEEVNFEVEEEEFENVPRKQKSLDNDGQLRDSRALGRPPVRQLSGDYENIDEEIDDRSAPASAGGESSRYGNVEFDRNEIVCRDKLIQPLPPLPAEQNNQAAHRQPATRPNQLPPPKQTQSTRNGGTANHDYVNLQYPAIPPPQPKPRPMPRKSAGTPSGNTPPIPPVPPRKIS